MEIGDRCTAVRKGISSDGAGWIGLYRAAVYEVTRIEAGELTWSFSGYVAPGRKVVGAAVQDAERCATLAGIPYARDLSRSGRIDDHGAACGLLDVQSTVPAA